MHTPSHRLVFAGDDSAFVGRYGRSKELVRVAESHGDVLLSIDHLPWVPERKQPGAGGRTPKARRRGSNASRSRPGSAASRAGDAPTGTDLTLRSLYWRVVKLYVHMPWLSQCVCVSLKLAMHVTVTPQPSIE